MAIKYLEKIRDDYLYCFSTAISPLRLLAVQWKKQKYGKTHMPTADLYIVIITKRPVMTSPNSHLGMTSNSHFSQTGTYISSWLWEFWVTPMTFTIFPLM